MGEVPSEKNLLHRNYNPWMLIMRSVYALGIKIQIWFSNAYKFIHTKISFISEMNPSTGIHFRSVVRISGQQCNITLYKFVQNKLQLLVQILICVENGRYYSYNVAYCFNEAPLLKIIANFPLVSKQAKQHILTFTKQAEYGIKVSAIENYCSTCIYGCRILFKTSLLRRCLIAKTYKHFSIKCLR